jgi:hypothetical protein
MCNNLFLKTTALWEIALCSVVEVARCFRGAYCLHHRGKERLLKRRSTSTRLHGAMFRKAVIFILAAVRT